MSIIADLIENKVCAQQSISYGRDQRDGVCLVFYHYRTTLSVSVLNALVTMATTEENLLE
jgi:hypothetical protein